ncbi:hypothetical protein C8Q76DRAFT_845017 [Earliella scabrosa]|nr:hypothetical protein C8Q76DRAFT_845017 [Earliella scabrosa]
MCSSPTPSELEFNALRETIKANNANTALWSWSSEHLGGWKRASQEWQDFNARWRYSTEVLEPGQVIPTGVPGHYNLSLQTKNRVIYVRQSYADTYDYLWNAVSEGQEGALIRGQPKTGKTVFLWYCVIRLVQDGQVVLLHTPENSPLLFYHDTVYIRGTDPSLDKNPSNPLPIGAKEQMFIWSVFDLGDASQPPYLAIGEKQFFVQAPSPYSQLTQWMRGIYSFYYAGALPLWTREELHAALPLHNHFDRLHAKLTRALEQWPDIESVLRSYHGVAEALLNAYGETPPDSVESVVNTLLDIAIRTVGPIPHDVYTAMVDLTAETAILEGAVAVLSSSQLELIRGLWSSWAFGDFPDTTISHHIVAINPDHFDDDGHPLWTTTFRSPVVRDRVRTVLARREDARRLFRSFRHIPNAMPMIDQLFKPIAHRALMETVDKKPWILVPVRQDTAADELTFRVNWRPQVTVIRGKSEVTLPKIKREKKRIHGLPATLEHRCYYIADIPGFPLIDAFTVDIDDRSRSATLSLFKISTGSGARPGCAEGYEEIRQLVSTLRDQLRSMGPPRKRTRSTSAQDGRSPSVTVRFVLVSPTDDANDSYTWSMPSGWVEQVEHVRGDVYLLQVPWPV